MFLERLVKVQQNESNICLHVVLSQSGHVVWGRDEAGGVSGQGSLEDERG